MNRMTTLLRLRGSQQVFLPCLRLKQYRHLSANKAVVKLHPYNRLKDIAKKLKVPLAKIEKKLVVKRRKKFFCNFDGVWFAFSSVKTIMVPFNTAMLLVEKHGKQAELIPLLEVDCSSPPNKLAVVAVLGHFNHGKTTLLDHLAGTDYVSIEKHGITQVIRTKTVTLSDQPLTIVDTPGQDIFFRMRNYGASVADMVVLVVALDDGICPQTEESIGVAEGINRPVIVCLNKIDLPPLQEGLTSRIAELTAQLREYDALQDAPILPISALTGEGLDAFTAAVTATAKLNCVNSNYKDNEGGNSATVNALVVSRHATVLNTWTSQRQGVRLHVVIRQGEIKVKDWFTCGGWAGYIGGIEIDDNQSVDRAAAGSAVKIRVQLKHQYDPVPLAESIYFVDKETALLQAEQRSMEYSLASYAIPPEDAESFQLEHYAKHTLQYRMLYSDGIEGGVTGSEGTQEAAVFVDDDGSQLEYRDTGEITTDVLIEGAPGSNQVVDTDIHLEDPRRRVVLKTDTSISLGTMYDALAVVDVNNSEELDEEDHSEPVISEAYFSSRRVVRGGVGVVTTSDVMIAVAAEAPILTYGVEVEVHARRLAESQKVAIHSFDKMQDVIDILLGNTEEPAHNLIAKRSKARY